MANEYRYREIGNICSEHRRKLGKTQLNVAVELDCSIENVSAFENGRNNNMSMLIWYLKNGLDIEKIMEVLE